MNDLHIGQKASRQKTITKHDIELFTKLTGDHQSIHYEEKSAQKFGFQAPIAQGGVTTGLLSAIVAHDLPGEGSVFLNVNYNFRRPVYIGDTIIAEVEVTAVRQDKPVIHLNTTITNQDGTICVDGKAIVYKKKI